MYKKTHGGIRNANLSVTLKMRLQFFGETKNNQGKLLFFFLNERISCLALFACKKAYEAKTKPKLLI